MVVLDRVAAINGEALALHDENQHASCRLKFSEALSILMKLEQERLSTNLEVEAGERLLSRQMAAEAPSDLFTCFERPSASIGKAVQAPIFVAEFDATLVKDEAILVNLYHMSVIYNLGLIQCRVGKLIEAEHFLLLSLELAYGNYIDRCSVGYDGRDNTYGVQVLIKIFHLLGCLCIHRGAHFSRESQFGSFPSRTELRDDQTTRFFRGLSTLQEAFSLAIVQLGCFHQYTCEIRTAIGNALIRVGMQEDARIMFDQCLWALIQAAMQDEVRLHEGHQSAAAA
jgi:hypothetical protein